jgi:alkylhydroperoxidase family enzyme
VAALDGDWSEFSPAERAAFAFARKLTGEPHRLGDADLDRLRRHYKDLQILEMTVSVAGNNGINRWKDAMGFPQEREGSRFLGQAGSKPPAGGPLPLKSFLTPTAEKYRSAPSRLAPARPAGEEGLPERVAARRRPPLESRAEVEAALAACRTRTPRLPLVEPDRARGFLPADWPKGPLPQWVCLLANFPKAGVGRAAGVRAAEEKGALKPLLKAQLSWVAARHDRAWYALGHARQRLRALGCSEDEVYALDGSWDRYAPGERAAFGLARKLTATPDLVVDDDVAELRKHFSDREVVQMIHYLTVTAFFDRVTEAAGLQLEK